MLLEIDKLLDAVAFCKTVREAFAMFINTPHQIVCHADIERSMAMFRKDVDSKGPHESEATPYWTPGTSPGVTRGGPAVTIECSDTN